MPRIRRTINDVCSRVPPTNVVDFFKLNRTSKRVSRACLATLACLLAAACTTAPSKQDAGEPALSVEQETPAAMGRPADAGLPGVELNGDLLYKVLVGEIAAKRGDMSTAADFLLEAARESRDYRLAQRATRVALDAERFDLAREAATLWVALQPHEERPKESLALIMVEQGRIDEAEEQLASLIDQNADEQGIEFHRIARLLGQLSHRDNALAVMQRLVSRYDDNADAHFAAAFLADRINDDEQVMESLDRALALRPDWEDAALAKLGHLIQNKYPREQVDAFAQGFLKTAPDAERVRVSYGRYLIDQDATGEALVQFQTVLKRQPDNGTALMAAGLLSVQKEEYDKARGYFLRHLKLAPNDDQIRLYLGQIAEERERYAEAEKWYREVSDRKHLFTARLHLATVVSELEGADAALEQLETVTPDDEEEFVRLALTKELILRDAHDLPRAKSVLDDAVARYPGNSDLLYAHGLLAAQLDQIDEHEKDMRALLAEDPNNAQALNALGYTLADATDRIQEAYTLISKALSMQPDDPFILDSMGWVQYRMGNQQDAIDYLERALSKRDDPEIAAHLGEVLWVAGQKDRAREIWAQAKKANPDNDILNETIERFTQ